MPPPGNTRKLSFSKPILDVAKASSKSAEASSEIRVWSE